MNRLNVISIVGTNVLRASMMRSTMIVMSLAFLSSMARAESEKDWTGLYGGLNAGVIFNDASFKSNNLGFSMPNGTCNTSSSFSSSFSGLQFGYTRQFNNKVVLGLETDYTYNFNNQGNAACTCEVNPHVSDRFAIKNQQQGSLRGRIGYALDNHLLSFFMVGASLANVGMNYRSEYWDMSLNHSNVYAPAI